MQIPLADPTLPACTVAYNGPITKAERWFRFKPKYGDIIICSPAKCGTTWMQAICGMLVSRRHDPEFEPARLSPWIDAGFIDWDAAIEKLDRQANRRYFKTHTPLDGVPYYPECTYVSIYRDPRDALISQQALAQIAGDGTSRACQPADIHAWLQIWLEQPYRAGLVEQPTLAAFAHHVLSFWQFRHLPNIHIFHYADLVRDPMAGVRAVAAAIAQPIDEKAAEDIVRATAFETMRADAQRYAPAIGPDGNKIEEAFFRRAAVGEWRDVFSTDELAAYRKHISELLPAELVDWLEDGSSSPRGHVQIPRLAESNSAEVREVEAAAGGGAIDRAVALARKQLDAGLEHPLFLNLRAYWHETAGRDALSLVDLNRARLLAPNSPIILNSLGLACARQYRQAEALEAFSRAVSLDPAFAPAQFNKGWASEDAGELEEAISAFQKAAELSPATAMPWARLASIAARTGDWPRARETAERALTLDAAHPVASIALAAAELGENNGIAAERRVRALLSRDTSPADRAYALTMLGDALHAQRRYREAFAAYAERNTLLRTLHADRFCGRQGEPMPQYVHWLCDYMDRLDTQFWGAANASGGAAGTDRGLPGPHARPNSDRAVRGPATDRLPASKHVFILGFARSGTTLLEEILASSTQVSATHEREAMAEGVRAFMATPRTMDRLGAVPESALEPYREDYWRCIRRMGIDPDGRVLVDKQPFSTIRLPLIARLFPSADVVFCMRDPRDVVLSCFRRQFQMTPSTFELLTLESTARFYDATMRIGELCRAKLPLRRLDVRHEDLLNDYEREIRRICAFIGLPCSDEMLRFSGRAGRRPVTTPSAAQIAKGLDRGGAAQWPNYKDELAPVMAILEPWIRRFGYPLE